MHPALLVIDPQNDFFESDNPNLNEFMRVIPRINAAVLYFKQKNWPVVFIQHTSSEKSRGSWAWKIYDGFMGAAEQPHISKKYQNAFWKTGLNSLLKSRNVDFVLLSGFLSEYCVLSSLRGAFERGYKGLLLREGIASLDNANTDFVLRINKNVSLEKFKKIPEQGS